MSKIYAYHVVTEKPMIKWQHIFLDKTYHNGVYKRVFEKLDIVKEIYSQPEKFNVEKLNHHTRVALRELALEKVRSKICPDAPSRMGCLYVSETLQESEEWAKSFINWGRPTYSIVKLIIDGNVFIGDAWNCFDATLNEEYNMLLAEKYWRNEANNFSKPPIKEILVNGDIEVVEIIKEINANLD